MDGAHPLSTPMVVRSLDVNKDPFRPQEKNEELLGPEIPYLSAIGALMYLANTTRPDIAFSVNLLESFDLVGYADAGYLSDPHKVRSQTGYVFICGGTAISWRSTKQSIVAVSSSHAEIIAIHETNRECVVEEEKVPIDVVELDYKDGDGVPVAGMTKLDFDGGLLQCISKVTYEDDINKVPSAPDVSNYLISEDEPSAVNGNKDSLRFDGMADNEVETRLKCNRFDRMADNEIERRLKAWHLSDPDAEKVFKALRAAGVKLVVVSNFDTQYVNDGRPFWQHTAAWHLCDPDAEKVFKALRAAGVKLVVVSNFDTQLRPVLRALNCYHWFNAVAVSAEVEAEKPNPTIFLKACELLEVNPDDAVHSSQPCWTCFFTEATMHKDGGPLDKESSNTIVRFDPRKRYESFEVTNWYFYKSTVSSNLATIYVS
ncbi:hypothetical protein FXO37_21973 [Capsicum annuum]|nr:hypothetical protein FXO37_21973 [Capsicum annuum]